MVAISLAAGTTSFAAELPTYDVKGLPISPVQAALLGAANVQESQVTPVASRHQVNILTARRKLNTATAASITTGAAH
jgi:hypothetical protein